MFYIEGRPGSRKVKSYLTDPTTSKFVFFNPKASGDHIHLAHAKVSKKTASQDAIASVR
jgi:hypothetical protein